MLRPHARAEKRGLTRRKLLASGGLAGVAAFAGISPFEAQAITADGIPDWLIRSSYFGLSDVTFTTTDGARLTLQTIQDLPIAATEDKSQVGSEDAFVLTFATADALTEGVYTFTHSTLGSFDFFVVPNAAEKTVSVTVNRSVNAPRHYPRPPRGRDADPPNPPESDAPTDDPLGTDPPEPKHHRHHRRRHRHLRRASLRRVGSNVVADLSLTPEAHVKSALVWLMRGDQIVGTAEARHLHGAKAHARMKPRHRPRGGRYLLIVITKDRKGRHQARRFRLTLQ